MSGRKHLIQQVLRGDVQPPSEGQSIVRAMGSRGGNIMEVEYPDGTATLCLIPAKFHKKIWIKKGTYLIIDALQGDDAKNHAVTGQIAQVLYADHVKQLKRSDDFLWPAEFADDPWKGAATKEDTNIDALNADMDQLEINDGFREEDASQGASSPSRSKRNASTKGEESVSNDDEDGKTANPARVGYLDSSTSSSDDDLPPLPRIQNRRIVEYEVSDSESD